MVDDVIQSDVGTAESLLGPLSQATKTSLGPASFSGSISFSNLSACKKGQSMLNSAVYMIDRYNTALSKDIENFNAIAVLFNNKDKEVGSQITQGL